MFHYIKQAGNTNRNKCNKKSSKLMDRYKDSGIDKYQQ